MGDARHRQGAGEGRVGPFVAAENRVRALLEGGTIADGVPAAETDADRLMEEALWYDAIAQAYHFPPTVVDEQPYELMNRMLTVASIRNEVQAAKMPAGG